MRRLDDIEKEMRGVVCFEFSDGMRIDLDAAAVEKYGAVNLAKQMGYADKISSRRLPVMQDGVCVGSLPEDFDVKSAESSSPFYMVRSGDFRRDTESWEACGSLGMGDLMALPDFRRATK